MGRPWKSVPFSSFIALTDPEGFRLAAERTVKEHGTEREVKSLPLKLPPAAGCSPGLHCFVHLLELDLGPTMPALVLPEVSHLGRQGRGVTPHVTGESRSVEGVQGTCLAWFEYLHGGGWPPKS